MYKIANEYNKYSDNYLKKIYLNEPYINKLIINEIFKQRKYNKYQYGGNFNDVSLDDDLKCDYDIDPDLYVENERITFLYSILEKNDIVNSTNLPYDFQILSGIKNKKLYVHKYKYEHINDKIDYISDQNSYNNCCNCFVYSLYFNIYEDNTLTNNGYKQLLFYLKCIYSSVLNINSYFNNDISKFKTKNPIMTTRIYLDQSVIYAISISNMYKCKNAMYVEEIVNILEKLFMNENVELYDTSCIKDCGKIGITRYYRLLSLIDKSVNVCILRDADGIVTLNECKNVDNFISSDKIIYKTFNSELNYNINVKLEDLIDIKDFHLKNFSYSYSKWLRSYTKDQFFNDNLYIINILAGLISFKIKIKEKIFNNSINYVLNYINNYNKSLYQTQMTDIDGDNIDNSHPLYEQRINEHVNENKINIGGFDEIFIKDLFKSIFSLNSDDIKLNMSKMYLDMFPFLINETETENIYENSNIEYKNISEFTKDIINIDEKISIERNDINYKNIIIKNNYNSKFKDLSLFTNIYIKENNDIVNSYFINKH